MYEQPLIRFRRETRRGEVALVVMGEIDMSTAPAFSDELDVAVASAHSPAYIDLSEVSFMDSSGLNVLINASRAAHLAGVQLVLIAPAAGVRKLLALTDMLPHFEIRD